jgi:Zn-dependent peptidase ImmA (M78 family)
MERLILQDSVLGDLTLERVIIEYDGPKLFTARDTQGLLYVAIFLDDSDDDESFLYVPLGEERARAFLAGVVSGREVFKASSEYAWIVTIPFRDAAPSARRITSAEIDVNWLPAENLRVEKLAGSSDGGLTKIVGDAGILGLSVSGLNELASNERDSISISLNHDGASAWLNAVADAPTLLSSLASCWAKLIWQEGITSGLRPGTLGTLEERLKRLAVEVSSTTGQTRLEGEYRDFLEAHDLKRIFGVDEVPSVVIVKEGLLGWILTADTAEKYSFSDLVGPLEELGDLLAGALDSVDGRGRSAIDEWRSRRQYATRDVLRIVTRMNTEELDLLRADLDEEIWESALERPDRSEILAAARMATDLPPAEVARLVTLTSQIPYRPVQRLDELSAEIRLLFAERDQVWLHGIQVAQWLRGRLELGPRDPVNPQDVLKDLHVDVVETALPERVDALSVWGPKHGPSVLINSSLNTERLRARRRATLAHELGHLLFDRDGALPLAEVLAGERYDSVEARVRAFAVEFLLPQKTAYEELIADSENPRSVVDHLTSRYGVSGEVAAWQIRNYGAELPARAYTVLRSYVSKPYLFWRTR